MAADLTGDGKPDLVVTSGPGLAVLINQGDGTFAPAVEYPADESPGGVVGADMNGDGKLNLVVPNWSSGTVSVLLGHGDGTFAPPVGYVTRTGPEALAAADLNGDGIPDLAVFGTNGNVDVMLGVCLP